MSAAKETLSCLHTCKAVGNSLFYDIVQCKKDYHQLLQRMDIAFLSDILKELLKFPSELYMIVIKNSGGVLCEKNIRP